MDYKEIFQHDFEDYVSRGYDEVEASAQAHRILIDKYADMIDWLRMQENDKAH